MKMTIEQSNKENIFTLGTLVVQIACPTNIVLVVEGKPIDHNSFCGIGLDQTKISKFSSYSGYGKEIFKKFEGTIKLTND